MGDTYSKDEGKGFEVMTKRHLDAAIFGSHALQYELRLRASLLAQVQLARSGGASFVDLTKLVARLKAAPP